LSTAARIAALFKYSISDQKHKNKPPAGITRVTGPARQRKCPVLSAAREARYSILLSVGWKKYSKFKRKEVHKSETASNQHLNHPDFHAGKLLLLFSLCHCKCAPRLLTLFLLSHSGAPSLNASMIVRFLLKFGT
jgi:hypothetical protein